LIEAPEVLQQQQSIPAQGQQLCSSGGQAASGNCAAGKGGISAADASRECNTIFNTQSSNYGALVGDSAGNCKRSAVDLKGQKRAAC
jgi:iron transport multicopper oxidase